MKYFIPHLLLIVTLYSPLYADPFDNTVQERLSEILLHEDFQPRRDAPGLFDHYRNQLAAYFGHLLNQIQQWLDSLAGADLGNSRIYDWIVTLLIGLKYLFYGIVTLLVLGPLGYMFYKFIWPLLIDEKTTPIEVKPTAPIQRALPSLEVLFSEHRYFELLLALHAHIRFHLHDHFHVPYSATDREAKQVLPDDEPVIKLFLDLLPIFERTVFARRAARENEVITLYQRYHQIRGTN